MGCLNELKFCEFLRNLKSNRCLGFSLSVSTNKKVLLQKKDNRPGLAFFLTIRWSLDGVILDINDFANNVCFKIRTYLFSKRKKQKQKLIATAIQHKFNAYNVYHFFVAIRRRSQTTFIR